ncbi:MAG: hypothetical protein JSU86_06325, partial [Phycisphaerales bacterium]
RTFTATDACGLTDTCTQTITIVDTTPPEITCPSDREFECDAVGDFGTASATDNCGDATIGEPVVVETPGECPGESVITRTFTATDACGLTDECTQRIDIVDTTPPELTCPPDLTFECDDIGDFGEPTITDNCDPDPEVIVTVIEVPGDCSQTPAFGGAAGVSPPPKLTVFRTYTATDQQTTVAGTGGLCGNVSECTQIIEIIDTTPPVITSCPSDATVDCGDQFVFTVTTEDTCEGELTVSCAFADAADPDRFEAVELSNGVYGLTLTGTTAVTVVCTGSDECNNTSAGCEFVVSGTCGQACSPGFWRNNLVEWCDYTPFSPTDYPHVNACFTPGTCVGGTCTGSTRTCTIDDECDGSATTFLEAFALTDTGCPLAPDTSNFYPEIPLLKAVSSSGGDDQTLFHCSAALLSSYAVAFPVDIAAVEVVMTDACTGSTGFDGAPVSWFRAFEICRDWNAVENQPGGCCPFSDPDCPLPGTSATESRGARSRLGGKSGFGG